MKPIGMCTATQDIKEGDIVVVDQNQNGKLCGRVATYNDLKGLQNKLEEGEKEIEMQLNSIKNEIVFNKLRMDKAKIELAKG